MEGNYWPSAAQNCISTKPISKSYIFQEIKREFCFLDDEKYYLVNILAECTHGQRLD